MKKNKIKVNKKLIIIISICVIIIALLLLLVYKLLFSNNGDVYGHRLDGIENYKIEDSLITDIKNSLLINEHIVSVNYVLKGKRMDFNLKVDDNLSVDDAKSAAKVIIEKIPESLKTFYDILINIDGTNEAYPIMGTCNNCSEIIW